MILVAQRRANGDKSLKEIVGERLAELDRFRAGKKAPAKR